MLPEPRVDDEVEIVADAALTVAVVAPAIATPAAVLAPAAVSVTVAVMVTAVPNLEGLGGLKEIAVLVLSWARADSGTKIAVTKKRKARMSCL